MPILTAAEKERMSKSVQWVGGWTQKSYLANDMASDSGWLGIANKDTEQRLAPQKTGNPFFVFSGALIEGSQSAKQIIFGTRYLFSSSGYLTRYRIKTKIGHQYSVFLINDPNGSAAVSELLSFTGAINGWEELGIEDKIITPGVEFDLMVRTSVEDLTPTTFNGQWDYSTPKDPSAPANGEIIHADNQSTELLINKTDDNATDRGAELLALNNGDKIDISDVSWTVQSVTDSGGYVTISVTPATQSSSQGIKDFTFSTTTATAIGYDKETAYYSGNANVRGMYIADGVYGDIVPSDDAYGVDIEVQNATISDDWDIVTSTQAGSTSSSKYYGYVTQADTLDIPDTFTSIGIFDKSVPNGSYVVGYSLTYTLNSTSNALVHRFALNDGTWEQFRREAKDTDDRYTIDYLFPMEVTNGSLKFALEAKKEGAANTLDIQFSNIMIDQKV